MAKKFYSKGKGANRKVIPISDKRGKNHVELIGYAVSYPIESMGNSEREFETSKEYVYKKLEDVEDLISMSQNFDESDFKKYPGLKKVKKILEHSDALAKNATMNAKRLMQIHGSVSAPLNNPNTVGVFAGGVGSLVLSIHQNIHEIIKFNYEAYMDLDQIIKKTRQTNEDSFLCSTHEGYSLPSLMADITDMEEELYDTDHVLMHTFRDMRREQYKARRNKNVIGSLKNHGHGEMRVIGDLSMVYNPDGSLRIKEFSRDTLS